MTAGFTQIESSYSKQQEWAEIDRDRKNNGVVRKASSTAEHEQDGFRVKDYAK